MTLDELLRAAAAKGMTHFTLYPVQSEDGKKTYWCARATPSTGHMYVSVTTNDPIESAMTALKSLPGAKKRGVTAAVKEPPPSDPQPQEELETWLPKA